MRLPKARRILFSHEKKKPTSFKFLPRDVKATHFAQALGMGCQLLRLQGDASCRAAGSTPAAAPWQHLCTWEAATRSNKAKMGAPLVIKEPKKEKWEERKWLFEEITPCPDLVLKQRAVKGKNSAPSLSFFILPIPHLSAQRHFILSEL